MEGLAEVQVQPRCRSAVCLPCARALDIEGLTALLVLSRFVQPPCMVARAEGRGRRACAVGVAGRARGVRLAPRGHVSETGGGSRRDARRPRQHHRWLGRRVERRTARSESASGRCGVTGINGFRCILSSSAHCQQRDEEREISVDEIKQAKVRGRIYHQCLWPSG